MKKIANKEQNTIKDIVKRMFGYNLKEVEFNGNKLKIFVEGKAYGDGYSAYRNARYKDGMWIGSVSEGSNSSIDILEKKLGVNNLKKISEIELFENYD